jgi:hypothetical protein
MAPMSQVDHRRVSGWMALRPMRGLERVQIIDLHLHAILAVGHG